MLEPTQVVAEKLRVLKEIGLVYSETPLLQHVHKDAYDFICFTESGYRYLFKNFSLTKSGASAGAAAQLLGAIDNFACGLFRSRIAWKVIKLTFLAPLFRRPIYRKNTISMLPMAASFWAKEQKKDISEKCCAS